ncbi:MAG: DUF547 domain-containing protein [Bacteroidota bacterium]
MKNLTNTLILLLSLTTLVNAQSNITNAFFDRTETFLQAHVQDGKVAYEDLDQNAELAGLIKEIETANLQGLDAKTIQAFYINAYNLLVIDAAAEAYPVNSVLRVIGFFDSKKRLVAGEKITLNQLEKDRLLKTYQDPRFHFVLVCGAIGCPPITDFAYRPELLDEQLETQTKKALNNPEFIIVNAAEQKAELSQIFEWYDGDFGGGKESARTFINKYRTSAIPADYKIGFYAYDWSLNDVTKNNSIAAIGNSANRYVVSAAIAEGTTETKIFNNLYTQRTGDGENLTQRSTFFTSFVSFLYGVNNRFNAGFDLRYRRVANEALPNSAFGVFGSGDAGSFRQGVTTIGPKIRWAPFEKLPNFSIESAFWFPIGEDLEGNGDLPFIDWNGATWWTQFFNDYTLSSKFSLFTEIDFLWEDIGNVEEGALNRVSTPATVILSYFPNPKTTLYVLTNYSPFWQENFDYFAQAGLGAKYQVNRNLEFEMLYTAFTNDFLQTNNGQASTLNFGIRVNR